MITHANVCFLKRLLRITQMNISQDKSVFENMDEWA